jgi:hypothetical protein
VPVSEQVRSFLLDCQDPETGFLVGPELEGFQSEPGVLHDLEHLTWHSTCAALPFYQQHSILLPHPLRGAEIFLNTESLRAWLDKRNLKNAWFEGNNILFAGQLLVYLRDVEKRTEAPSALQTWFAWLDENADPATGLWGSNGHCSSMEAVYGGYHQLLVYYYENHPLSNPHGLVDTVLALQHEDGGFNPIGNAGACEDVDCVDILVNCYKRLDYKRVEIRFALRRCLRHILETQNTDGGFPYNRNQPQSHMGIPGTDACPNVSCTFPTWFRIHTLALIAEVLPNAPEFCGTTFQFNRALSMGWHASPLGWQQVPDGVSFNERLLDGRMRLDQGFRLARQKAGRLKSVSGSILRKAGLHK